MRVTILGSGSQGNATLFESAGARVLVDAGLSSRTIRERFQECRCEPLGRVDAVLITHAHADHVAHAESVAASFGAPLLVTPEALREMDIRRVHVRMYERRSQFCVGGLRIRAHPIPHDAPQVALVIRDASDCVGLVTDLGHVPESLAALLEPCRTLLLEFNHDPELLQLAPYPESVRARVGGNFGHLANAQAGALLRELRRSLRRVVLMHLSESNNSPQKALRAAESALAGLPVQVLVAKQNRALALDDGADQLSLAI